MIIMYNYNINNSDPFVKVCSLENELCFATCLVFIKWRSYEVRRKYTFFTDCVKTDFLNTIVNNLLIFRFLLLIYASNNSL